MKTAKELLASVKITEIGADLEREYGKPRLNSTDCEKGDIFIAVKGNTADGHDFIPIALSRGAGLIVAERRTPFLESNPHIPFVIVENTALASAHIFNEYCRRPGDSLILIAVTGTNGKTSTTYFLKEIFETAGYKTGIIGTVRCMIGDRTEVLTDVADSKVNSMTTPSPDKLYPMLRKMADEGVEAVFMEASSHALCQHRLDALRFYTGIFTGLTGDHLDYHKSMENYYLAKKRLFSLCDTAVINADCPYSQRLISELSVPYLTYSSAGKIADYRAENVKTDSPDGISYACRDKNDNKHLVECTVAGGFTVSNTLAAIATAGFFGIKAPVWTRAISACRQIPGRMERVALPDACDFSVFIDYAHTPDALENVLRTLASFVPKGGRLCVLFGCGGDRDKTKRPIMGRIATSLADITVITSDNSRSENPRRIICDILHGVKNGAECKVVEKRDAAISYIIKSHRPGDVILLAGKGHEDYLIDSLGKHPFSEAYEVQKAVRELLNG